MNGTGRIFVAALSVLVLTGCSSLQKEAKTSATATCTGDVFQTSRPETPAPSVKSTLILVDLANNNSEALDRYEAEIQPIVKQGLSSGGYVRLVVSGGDRAAAKPSPCLDGKSLLYVDRKNEATQKKAREKAEAAIRGDVRAFFRTIPVGETGSPTTLLGDIPTQLGELYGDRQAKNRQVVLISDLLGAPAKSGDCLSLDQVEASTAAADSVVKRCLATRQFSRMGTQLRIVRPHVSKLNNQQLRMSGYVSDSLCHQITPTSSCTSSQGANEAS